MRNKSKENTKVPKSAKTRLSDLTPQKHPRGGKVPGGIAGVGGGPAATPPGLFQPPKKNAAAACPQMVR